MRFLITLSFLIISTLSSQDTLAQDICNDKVNYSPGGFELSSNDICHDEKLSIKNTADVQKAVYYYNYRGESYNEVVALGSDAESIDFSKLIRSGVYTVIQVGEKNGKKSVSCQEVKVRVANLPVFSYDYCPGSSFVVSIPKNPINDYKQYQIKVNNEIKTYDNASLPIMETFNGSSKITIKVSGTDGGKSCASEAEEIKISFSGNSTPLEFFPDIDQLKITQDNTVQIDFTGADFEVYDIYRYKMGAPTSSEIKVLSDQSPGRVFDTPENAVSTSYCYRIDLTNQMIKCPALKILLSREPQTLCTLPLLEVNSKNLQQNVLRWVKYNENLKSGESIKLSVARISQGNMTEIGKGVITNESFNYTDKDNIDCSKEYCYRIQLTKTGRNKTSVSYSNQICVNHKSDPFSPPENLVVSTQEDNKNLVKFRNNSDGHPISRWVLYKNINSEFHPVDSVYFDDPNAKKGITDPETVTKKEIYVVVTKDVCDNSSRYSEPAVSVFLEKGDPGKIKWNRDSPFSEENIQKYEIIYLSPGGGNELKKEPEPSSIGSHKIDDSVFTDEGSFRLKAISMSEQVSFSNIITVPIPVYLFLPNAFSPNKDEINDYFYPVGKTEVIQDFKLEIFTPSGFKITEISEPKPGWDGFLPNGMPAQVGTYIYRMSAQLTNGQTIDKNGSFRLLK